MRDRDGAEVSPAHAGGIATAWVTGGALVGGVGAYLFQIVGTRALGADDYAPIGVLWTLQYLLVSVGLTAIEAYVTRTVALVGPNAARVHEIQRILMRWLVIAAVVLGVLGYLLRGRLFGGLGDLAAVLAALVLTYGAFTVVRGRAAGADRFRAYGLATSGESVLRLAAAIVALGVAATTRSLAWVFPIGPAVVTLVATLRPGRVRRPEPTPAGPAAPAAPGGLSAVSPSRFLASTVTANGAVQVLLAGGPLALVVLGATPREISVFFTTVTLARAPMTLVLGGGLSRILPPLLRLAEGDQRGPARVGLWTAVGSGGTALLAGVLAWVAGPPVVAALFGEGFRPEPLLAAVATAGSVLAIGGLGLDQLLIALGREAELPRHWLGGVLAAALLVAVLPFAASDRVVVAFTAGTAVALTTLTWRVVSGPPGRAPRTAPRR